MVDGWLTIKDAAERVRRSEGTIRRWVRDKEIVMLAGRVQESKLIEVDRDMRTRARRFADRPRARGTRAQA